MTTRSSRRSSISLTRVSTASWPYWSPGGTDPGQAVRLVDEQHPAGRGGDGLGRLRRRLAQVAGDQLGAVDLDELALGQQPEGVVDAADQPGDRRLAGARVAREDEVSGDRGTLQPGLATQLLHAQYGDLPVDLPLDPPSPIRASSSARSSSRLALRVAPAPRARVLSAGFSAARVAPVSTRSSTSSWADTGSRSGHRGSWAAAATEALPITRMVGSPSSQAAEATSASAAA